MYYTGFDPRTMEKVYVPVSLKEKQMQRALIQYRNPENYDIVKAALIQGGREDLIGFDEHCLIPPRKMGKNYHPAQKHSVEKKNAIKTDKFKTDRFKTEKSKTEKSKIERAKADRFKTDRVSGKEEGRGKAKKKTIRNVHKKKKRG